MKLDKKKQGLFLTQDDIDTALRAVDTSEAITEADDMEALILDEADIVEPDSEDLEYFGLLSQEDIEALLHGDLAGSGEENDAQDVVDSLLATAGSEKNAASPVTGEQIGKRNVAQDDVEELIQKTVAGVHEESETEAMEAPATGPEALEEGGAVSQDDIDQLLMSAIDDPEEDADPGPVAGLETPEEGGAVSQDDIDQLLMSAIDDPEEDADPGPVAGPETLEEGGAVSQDDIDSLLAGAMDQTDVETETDSGEVSIETQGKSASGSDIESGISQVDLDQLMGEALSGGDEEEVSAQDDDTSSEHISQGDINRLLKESIEEEDLPEEEAAEEPDAIEEADAIEPVILAVDEDSRESTAPIPEQLLAPIPRKTARGRFKKKRQLVGVAAGVVLALAVSMMTMLPGQEETVLQPRVLTFSVPQPGEAGYSTRSASVKRIYLTGFVVLAPPNSAAITYVNADLLLDLSDASFVDVIKENEAFVRDIVYGTINSELMTRDISTIDEISLELAIRRELGRIIPRGAIERIDFERFSMA